MDNDDKIEKKSDKSSVHKKVLMFLGDELKPLERGAVSSYNLTLEYQKTRANKNHKVWILLAVCFLSVGIAAFLTTLIVYNYDKKIEININTFDDLNLRTLLSNVGRTQSLFEAASKKKASLVASLEAELKQAEQKKENDMFTMQSVSTVSSKAALRRRAEALENEYNELVKRLHEDYDARIQAAENEIVQYAKQLDNYDSGKITRAQEQEAIIDSQKQLHDLEKKNISDGYEKQISDLRLQMEVQQKEAAEAQKRAVEEVRKIYQAKIDLLDPYVKDVHGNQVVSDSKKSSPSVSKGFVAESYKSALSEEDEDFSRVIDEAERSFFDFNYISEIVSSIPQERDIPSYVNAMRATSYSIGNALAKKALSLQKEKDSLEGELTSHDAWFESYVTENLCDGIVLDASGADSFRVYVSQGAKKMISDGITAAQIREGRKIIAEVTLEESADGYIARSEAPVQSGAISTFAKLYMVKQTSKK